MKKPNDLQVAFPSPVAVDVVMRDKREATFLVQELTIREFGHFLSHFDGAFQKMMETATATSIVQALIEQQTRLDAALCELWEQPSGTFVDNVPGSRLIKLVALLLEANESFFVEGVDHLMRVAGRIVARVGLGLTQFTSSSPTDTTTQAATPFPNFDASSRQPIPPFTPPVGTA